MDQFYKEIGEQKDMQIFALEQKLQEQEELLRNSENFAYQGDQRDDKNQGKLERLQKKYLKLKNFNLDLKEAFQELQNQYLMLESKLKEEELYREELMEAYQ